MWSIGWQVLPLLLKSTQCYHMLRPSSRSWLRQLGLELLNLLCVALALLVQILSQCLLVSISPLPRAKMWNIWNYELYKFDLVRKCNHPGCSLGGKQAWIGCSQRAVATWDNCLRNSSTSWPWRLRSSSKSWAFGPISESVSQNVFPIFVKVLCSGYNSMHSYSGSRWCHDVTWSFWAQTSSCSCSGELILEVMNFVHTLLTLEVQILSAQRISQICKHAMLAQSGGEPQMIFTKFG